MPALTNPKHEAFARARFKGMTATAAYVSAGYKPNDSHACRLDGNGKIKARIAELTASAAKKAVEAVAFDAATVFADLQRSINAARQDGAHSAVMTGHTLLLEALGYRDSPTLTHDHLFGRKVSTEPADILDGDNVVPLRQPERRFAKVLDKMRKRLDGQS